MPDKPGWEIDEANRRREEAWEMTQNQERLNIQNYASGLQSKGRQDQIVGQGLEVTGRAGKPAGRFLRQPGIWLIRIGIPLISVVVGVALIAMGMVLYVLGWMVYLFFLAIEKKGEIKKTTGQKTVEVGKRVAKTGRYEPPPQEPSILNPSALLRQELAQGFTPKRLVTHGLVFVVTLIIAFGGLSLIISAVCEEKIISC